MHIWVSRFYSTLPQNRDIHLLPLFHDKIWRVEFGLLETNFRLSWQFSTSTYLCLSCVLFSIAACFWFLFCQQDLNMKCVTKIHISYFHWYWAPASWCFQSAWLYPFLQENLIHEGKKLAGIQFPSYRSVAVQEYITSKSPRCLIGNVSWMCFDYNVVRALLCW